MGEKLEQTGTFIQQFALLKKHNLSMYGAINDVHDKLKDYFELHVFMFGSAFSDNLTNQITFAKIWAGEIELIEKKDKYVIYQINDNSKTGKGYYTIYAMNKESQFYPRRVNKDGVPDRSASPFEVFDQEFAFALRDTGKFKIKEVVE